MPEEQLVVVLSDSNKEGVRVWEWLGKGRWLIDWVGGGEGLQSGGDRDLELGKAQRRKKNMKKIKKLKRKKTEKIKQPVEEI